MIRAFRKLGDTWFFKLILVLAILSFVSLWGVGGVGNMFSATNQSVVTMEGDKISGAELLQEFEWETNKYRKMMPMGFTYEEAARYGLLEQSLYTVIYKAVMKQISERNQILIPDSIVFNYVKSNPEFMDETGRFSRNVFLQILAESNLSEADFIKIARADILENYILDTNRAFPFAPAKMTEMITEQRTSLRDAVVIDIKTSDMKLPSDVTDDEMLGFYEENPDNFMTPEKRSFAVASISYKDIANQIEISEEELKEIFEMEKDTLHTQETRHLNGFMFEAKDEQKANDVVAELKKGEKDFKRVAMEKMFQFEGEHDWGYVSEEYLIEDLKEPVFSAEKNAIIGPVKTLDNRFYVFQVIDIKPFVEATYETKKDELLARIKQERSEEITYALIEAIEEDVGINTNFDEIAVKHGLKNVSYTDKTLSDTDVEKIYLSAAYSLDENETSGVMDMQDGIFITRVGNINESVLKSFDTVKDDIKVTMENDQKHEIAFNLVREVIEQSKTDGIVEVADDKNLKSRNIKNIKMKTEDNKTLSKQDVTRLFALSTGEAFYNPTANGFMIVGLKEIKNNPEKIKVTEKSEIKNNIEDSVISSLEQQFYMDYASLLNVKTNDKVIDESFKALLRTE